MILQLPDHRVGKSRLRIYLLLFFRVGFSCVTNNFLPGLLAAAFPIFNMKPSDYILYFFGPGRKLSSILLRGAGVEPNHMSVARLLRAG